MTRRVRAGQPAARRSRTAAVIERLPEGITLALLVIVPGFVNLASERIFEEEKALLLRAAAAVSLPGALWLWRRQDRRGSLEDPILIAFVAMTLLLIASALFGVAPREALAGAYIRRHGIATWLALAVPFAVMSVMARRADGREQICAALVAGSVWPSVYTLVQAAGADPVPWSGAIDDRSGSTLGNPILLGGYLAAALPIALMQACRAPRYLAVVALQAGALIASGSRGPLLAVIASAFVFAAAASRSFEPRRRLAAGATAAMLIVATVLVLAARPAIVGRYFDTTSGSGRVRVLIWQGVVELARARPSRVLIGYGPESLRRVFPPYLSPEIGRIEGPSAMPDRSHNETLDMIVNAGILGAVAQLAFFAAVFVTAWRLPDWRWRAGLSAAAVAHVIEVQLGIATVSSRLVLFAAAALASGLARSREEANTRTAVTQRSLWSALLVTAAVAALSPVSMLASRLPAADAGATPARLIQHLQTVSLVSPVLLLAALAAAILVARAISGRAPLISSWAHGGLLAAGALIAIPLAVTPSRADVVSRAAAAFEARSQWVEAAVAYGEASRLQPAVAYYQTALARTLIQASGPAGAAGHSEYLRDAHRALDAAERLDPLDADHLRNLASLNRIEARTAAPDRREPLLLEADRLYAAATRLSPNMPALWTEWANVRAERRRFADALETLDRAISLDDRRFEPWLLRGHVSALQRKSAAALQAYDRALSIKPQDLGAMRGRAVMLADLGRGVEARVAATAVLAIAPADATAQQLVAQLAPSPPRTADRTP